MPLHMTKIAYRSGTLDNLRAWVEAGDEAHMTTRYCPKRHAEMIGGSLYWIMDCDGLKIELWEQLGPAPD